MATRVASTEAKSAPATNRRDGRLITVLFDRRVHPRDRAHTLGIR
jgi:hypothetical protein